MKKLLFQILVFCLVSTSGFTQPNFAYSYSHAVGASIISRPNISIGYDGSIFGVSWGISSTSNVFLLFKIDMNGNMLWQKDIDMSPMINTYAPQKICMLSDSTFVMVIKAYSPTDEFILIKCDFSGNIIWTKVYSSPTVAVGGGLDLVPSVNGSMIVSCASWVAFINAAGSVESAFAFSFPVDFELYALQSISKGQGSLTLWGVKSTASDDVLFLFDIDTAGIISNFYNYSIVGETPTIGFSPPSNFIGRSPSGGFYSFCNLETNNFTRSVVMYFDALNNPLWAKRFLGFPDNIYASKDSGCIISSSQRVIHLDTTGLIKWQKTLDDTSSAGNYLNIVSMVSDTGSGWYSAIAKPNIYLIHTDSLFDGFCQYENYSVVISPLTVYSNPDSVTPVPITFSNWNFTPTIIPYNIYRFDGCSGVLIDSTTAINEVEANNNFILIYPNPAKEKITIKFPKNIVNGTISISNFIGQKLIENNVYNQSENTIWLDKLPPGMYIVHVKAGQIQYSQKFVVQKE